MFFGCLYGFVVEISCTLNFLLEEIIFHLWRSGELRLILICWLVVAEGISGLFLLKLF